MKIFLTGGLGVIGSCMASKLHQDGHKVTIFDSCEKARNRWIRQRLADEGMKGFIVGRMEDPECKKFLQYALDCDLVIHAAASTGIPHSEKDPTGDWAANVEATRALLEVYRMDGSAPPTVVFSSVKPYSTKALNPRLEGTRYVPGNPKHMLYGIDEEAVLEPDEPYAASKMAQSALVTAYARSYNMPLTTLRFSNLYGPAPCHGPRHGWLTWFCISAAIGRPLEVQGSGYQTRDMLFWSDILSAVLAAHKHIRTTQGEIYNVGGGLSKEISVAEAAKILSDTCGIEVKHTPGRRHEDMLFTTDTSKFAAATEWKALVPPREGIAKIYDWAVKNKESLKLLYQEE